MALITEPAVRSKWVSIEINYAILTNKPMILLKDASVNISIKREWIPFSKSSSTETIFHSVMSAVAQIKSKRVNLDAALIGNNTVALFAFIVGWTLTDKINKR
jgi:hypothetical protein